MPQADATPHFGEREVAPPMRQQMASPMRADGRPYLSDALADRCKGCVLNSLPTTRGVQIAETKAAARDNAVDVLWLKPTSPPQ